MKARMMPQPSTRFAALVCAGLLFSFTPAMSLAAVANHASTSSLAARPLQRTQTRNLPDRTVFTPSKPRSQATESHTAAVTSARPSPISSHARPATCPANGTWVGFTGGNTDINLEYESSGGQTAPNSCPADDEPLVIPSAGVSKTVTIPAGTTAQATDTIFVDSTGTLLVSCTESTSVWNVCQNGHPVAALDDEEGNDITVDNGTMEVAPGASVVMQNNAISVQGTGSLLAQDSTIEAPDTNLQPGAWDGIDFETGTTGTLTRTTINMGGGGLSSADGCSGCYADVVVSGTANVSITSSTIENSYGNGVEVTVCGNPTLTSDTFTYCTNCGFSSSDSPAVQYDSVPGNLSAKLSGLSATGFGVNDVQIGTGTTESYSTGSGTWPNAGIPYLLDSSVDIAGGASLTIPSATTVEFEGTSLYVQSGGTFIASGASGAGNEAAFTSYLDYPSASPSPQPGDWGGVEYESGSSGSLTYATFNYGGGGFTGGIYAEVAIEGVTSPVTVTNSQFENSYGNGIELSDNAQTQLTDDGFTYCTNCSFNPSSDYPVQFDFVPGNLVSGGTTPLLTGLTSSGYSQNDVVIPGGNLAAQATWPNSGIDYLINGNIDIESGGALTVPAGVTLLMNGGLTVESGGGLTLAGTPAALANVTSYNDYVDSGTQPQPGDWPGITYLNGSSGAISYASIRYGGEDAAADLTVGTTSSALAVTDSSIIDSASSDVVVQASGAPVFARDTFGLVQNGFYSIDNQGTNNQTISATPDYWSQTSGPVDSAADHGKVKTAPFFTHTASTTSTGTLVSVSVLQGFGLAGSLGAQATGGTGGGLAVDRFSANPQTVAVPGSPTNYFDVRTWSSSTFTSVVVEDCTVATGQMLEFFNGSAWLPVSGQTAAAGCVSATLNSSSTPTLSALFGAGVDFTDGATATVTTLIPSPNPVAYGQPLKLTAGVTASTGSPTGTVAFKNGSTVLGSEPVSAGSAALTISTLKPGNYSLTAVYTPTAHNGFGASTSVKTPVVVDKATLDVTLKESVPYTTTPSVTNIAATSADIVYAGFVNGDKASTAIGGKLGCKTTATATSKPGTYPITSCTGLTATNYTVVYEQGTLTVTTVGTKITFNGASETGSKGSYSTSKSITRKKAVYFEATLDTATNKLVSGEKLTFKLGSGKTAQTCVATTASTGVAVCKLGSLTVADGKQPLAISFAGDSGKKALYNASTVNDKVKVSG